VLGWRGRCRPPRPWICPKPDQSVASRSAKRDTEGHPDSVNLTVPPVRIALVWDYPGEVVRDAEAALRLGEEHHAAIRGDPSAIEGGADLLACYRW